MIHVTPEMLEATYELLRRTPPFSGWKLPVPDEVGFLVSGSNDTRGRYWFENERHHISVSHRCNHTLDSVIRTVAHEMCHVRDQAKGAKSDHGRSWQRMADQVCRRHHFDRGQF